MLLPKTYVATNYFTAADVALYGALYPVVVSYMLFWNEESEGLTCGFDPKSKLQPAQYYSTPSITRYFDHIQNQKPIRAAVAPFEPVFGVVYFDFDNAPAVERKTEPPKKKEKKAAAAPVQENSPAAPTPAAPTPAAPTAVEAEAPPPQKQEKSQKKEKKEKKDAGSEEGGKKNKGAKAAPAAEDAGEPVPSMIDLRVGHIVDGEPVIYDGRTRSNCLQSSNIQMPTDSI